MIYLKNSVEIAKMRVAGKIVKDALELVRENVRVGVSTLELDKLAYDFILKCGATPSFLNYNGFPATICASVNEVVVHGFPSDYRLKDGDIISVDMGAMKDGFHGDAARTFEVGTVADEVKQLIKVTEESFFKGIAEFKEGNRLSDISKAIQAHAEGHGYGVVREMCGHGIGRDMHEDPEVLNFFSGRRGVRLEKGMALAIEPMINLGTAQVFLDENGWSVVTADRKPSAHYENTTVLTENGVEILTL